MNTRRKIWFRKSQQYRRQREIRIANKGEAVLTECKRCHRTFMPKWIEGLAIWQHCCETCGARNLFDAMDLPTPPELIDCHSLRPTLTDGEFKRKLRESP